MNDLGKANLRLLVIGAFLALVGILLAVSFHLLDNHRWYWSIAHILCVLGMLSAASGGFLMGHSLARAQKRRLWPLVLGGVSGLAWIGGGIMAVGSAFLGMNYFPPGEAYLGWDSYRGDYLVGRYHIICLQLATVAGLVGGASTGFGIAPKRQEDDNEQ